MKIYGIAITLAATLLVSCSRDEGATPGGGCRELAVNVQMASSDWTTRSGADGTSGSSSAADGTLGSGSAADGTHDRTQVLGSVALDEQLEIVAECGKQDTPEYGTSEALTPDAPLTRGTPIISASQLGSLGFAVYTNSVFTKNCTATNNGGSWNIADNITLDLDKNKYSYYAYAPAAVAADNGIVLQADGKKLTYTAPDDITKQPDLCWAVPTLNDPTGSATFAMQHALTAIGVKVRAANVEIKSIKLLGVSTSGTLDLTSGAWGGVGTPKSLTFPLLTTTPPDTGDGVADLIASDGYLMLPPQALGGDDKTLVIVYRYTTGSDQSEHTGTHKLSNITGGDWVAGQRVNYVIQLKSNFSLSIDKYSATVPYTASSYTLNYTTGSSAPSIDPQATCGADWITGLAVNRSTRKISFNYSANTAGTARKTAITVTSGFTTKNFVFTQLIDPWITLSTTTPPVDYVPRAGSSYTTTVTTPVGLAWKIASASNCSVSPASGSGSAYVTITVPRTTAYRTMSITFSTNAAIAGITEKTVVWSGKQTAATPDCFPIPLPGFPNTYVRLNDMGHKSQEILLRECLYLGYRLPTMTELEALYKNNSLFGPFSGVYWSDYTDRDNDGWVQDLNSGATGWIDANEARFGRCVKDIK